MKKTLLAMSLAMAFSAMAVGATTVTLTPDKNSPLTAPVESSPADILVNATKDKSFEITSGTNERQGRFEINNSDQTVNVFLSAVGTAEDGTRAEINIHDLDEFVIKTVKLIDKGADNPLNIRNGGKISFSNINNVQMGTSENPLEVDQVIHALYTAGGVEFSDIENLNIYSKGATIHLQSYKSDDLMTISNVENVNIVSKSSVALHLTAILPKDSPVPNPLPTQTLFKVSDVKNFYLEGGYYGIMAVDEINWGEDQHAEGPNAIDSTITAENVVIKGGNGAIVSQRTSSQYAEDAGKFDINIQAANQILIESSNDFGIYSSANAGSSTRSSVNVVAPRVNINAKSTGIHLANGSTTVKGQIVDISGATAIGITEKGGAVSFTNYDKQTNTQLNLNGNVITAAGTLTMVNQDARLSEGSTFNAGTFKGNNSTITFNTKKAGAINITNNQSQDLKIFADGAMNDQYDSNEALLEAMTEEGGFVNVNGEVTYGGRAGTVSNEFFKGPDGVIYETRNASMEAYSKFSAATLAQFRGENSTLTERLGDLRDTRHSVGAWARVYGMDSQVKSDLDVDVQTTSLQVGADYSLNDNWLIGAAFAYTDMDSDFDNGSGTSDGYSLAAYASGFFDCGGYIDVIGRIGRLSTDMTASTLSVSGGVLDVSYGNTALSLAVETGYRWNVTPTFYAEPQLQLTYGYVVGDDFTSKANAVLINQDNFQTLVGRLGARIGANFAEGAGSVFMAASVNHEFLGDADSQATALTTGKRVSADADLSGTWVTYGVGAQFNATDNMSFYGSLNRSSGNDYQEDYRYSVGMRYVW